MKLQFPFSKFVGLMLATIAALSAQDLTITNARIVAANGAVIERGSIVVRAGKIAVCGVGRAGGREWPGNQY